MGQRLGKGEITFPDILGGSEAYPEAQRLFFEDVQKLQPLVLRELKQLASKVNEDIVILFGEHWEDILKQVERRCPVLEDLPYNQVEKCAYTQNHCLLTANICPDGPDLSSLHLQELIEGMKKWGDKWRFTRSPVIMQNAIYTIWRWSNLKTNECNTWYSLDPSNLYSLKDFWAKVDINFRGTWNYAEESKTKAIERLTSEFAKQVSFFLNKINISVADEKDLNKAKVLLTETEGSQKAVESAKKFSEMADHFDISPKPIKTPNKRDRLIKPYEALVYSHILKEKPNDISQKYYDKAGAVTEDAVKKAIYKAAAEVGLKLENIFIFTEDSPRRWWGFFYIINLR